MSGRATTVAILSAGEMGARVGAALAAQGIRVLTCISCRSHATRERALRAHMEPVELHALRAADILLAIVPSDQSITVADALLDAGALGPEGPLYVDCNPLSAGALRELAARLASVGCSLVDACLLGGSAAGASPSSIRLCACGTRAAELGALASAGLEIQILPGPLGTASALRRGVSGISKGLVGLLALNLARAEANGVSDLLRGELARSHEALLQWASRQSARLPREAPRWAAELREVAAGEAFAGQGVFQEIADYLATLGVGPGS